MVHSLHGDIHDVGLQDNCVACTEHAEAPWSTLDSRMIRDLIRRNYHHRYNPSTATTSLKQLSEPRSETEAVAMRNITNLMERMGALMSLDRGGYIRSYLESKWDIDFGDGR